MERAQIRHFTDLEVWRRSHALFLQLMPDVDGLPRKRAAMIVADQLIRSVGSIGANIVEGFNRSKAKFVNSLDIALGEANESENWLYKLRDATFISHDRANQHLQECIEIEKMLSSLHQKIRSR